MYAVREGDDLAGIAARELGDPARWVEIVRLNRLLSTSVEAASPGVWVGEVSLADPAPAGATTLRMERVGPWVHDGLIVGLEAMAPSGDPLTYLGSVVSVDPETNTIAVEPALEDPMPAGIPARFYLPETLVRYLTPAPGTLLQLPAASIGPPVRTESDRLNAVLGSDFALDGRFNLYEQNGDLARAQGIDNFLSALLCRLITPQGSLAHRPMYGSMLPSIIGARRIRGWELLAAAHARQAILQDPRVYDVPSISIQTDGDRIRLNAQVVAIDGSVLRVDNLVVWPRTERT